MKKYLIMLFTLLFSATLNAQELLHLYNGGNVVFEKSISAIDSIHFSGANSIFNFSNDYLTFPCSEVDSITFSTDTLMSGNDIYITYNGSNVNIINPLASSGVTITNTNASVTVTSAANISDIVYHVSGTTSNGYLYITSDSRFTLSLEGTSITNSAGPAIYNTLDKKMSVILAENSTNYLIDGTGNSNKAALQSKGQIVFNGSGNLNVTGIARNGIHSDDYVKINSGSIVVTAATADGIHCDYFIMNDGSLTITSSGDGIDGDEGYLEINGGTINITSATADTKSMKCDSTITINGGTITIHNSGAESKGIKCGKDLTINGGTINITPSGATVLETTTSGYNPVYCTGMASDSNIRINGGTTTITLPASNNGGKGISADGNIYISSGYVVVSTAGSGASYTVTGSTKDAYTSACIKSDGIISLTGGNITCTSTGAGGKGIVSDGAMIIGTLNANDSALFVTVSTSGERITVSAASGWGSEGDYANPKAIKAEGNLTINSGIITVTCTQTNEGGECIESKNILTINGGKITAISSHDDALNAANGILISGGTTYANSSNNDGIDSNGWMTISGGLTIAAGSGAPEDGFDCDNNTFTITGGILVGTGGGTSAPSTSACTQRSIEYSHSGNNAIRILRSSNSEEILTFYIPTVSGSGGGGPGGGSSSTLMLFSSSSLTQGTYTLKYGGTISGGTNFHGYYTGATYTGGSTKTFTTSSMVTTVN